MKRIAALGLMFCFLTNAAMAESASQAFKYAAYTGRMICDNKVLVTVTENKKQANHFDIAFGKLHYQTIRVATESGAIRMEDQKRGIVWLQMSNKSMLLDEKQGRRLANNCRNDAQVAAEKALEITPDTILSKP